VGGSREFRHGLLRAAVYNDLLPDERARLHARLAAILQARLDADPEPGLGPLSRLGKPPGHWAPPKRSPTSSAPCPCGTVCPTPRH
jgi:hypothetical protein